MFLLRLHLGLLGRQLLRRVVHPLRPGVVEIFHEDGGEGEKYFVSGGFAFTHLNSTTDISAAEVVALDDLDGAEARKNLNEFHTYAVYKYTARGLFERHKLLLSLQMCVRILQSANQVNSEEWQFFLRGGNVLDKSQQPANPAPDWISEESWDNITELENIAHFKDVVASFEQNPGEWEKWYRTGDPENSELPGDWENKCNELQRMIRDEIMAGKRGTPQEGTFTLQDWGTLTDRMRGLVRAFRDLPLHVVAITHADVQVDDSSVRRNELPMVWPKPGSSGPTAKRWRFPSASLVASTVGRWMTSIGTSATSSRARR